MASSGTSLYSSVTLSSDLHMSGRRFSFVVIKDSTEPLSNQRAISSNSISHSDMVVASRSNDAMIDGLRGLKVSLEYLIRRLIAGTMRNACFELLSSLRGGRAAVEAAGMIRETRVADRYGLACASAGTSCSGSSRFMPAGIRLGRYSSTPPCCTEVSAVLRLAAARKVTKGN